jgi:hypothetical protein
MRVRVNLPPGALIECLGLCLSIARALCSPTDKRELVGIECIYGKWLPPFGEQKSADPTESETEAGTQPILVSDGERRPNWSLVDNVAGSEGDAAQSPLIQSVRMRYVEASWLWQPLNPDDRRALKKLLPQLPELLYPMSENDVTAFTEAYLRLRNRPRWVPDLVNAWAIEQRKAEQRECVAVHMRQLLQEFEERRVTVVDDYHARVATLSAGTFIPRTQAISYLERHGLAYDDGTTSSAEPGVTSTCDDVPRKPQASELPANNKKNTVGIGTASPADRKAAVQEYWALKKACVPNFVEVVAKKYGVSVRTINYWVNPEQREKKEKQKRPQASFFPSGK